MNPTLTLILGNGADARGVRSALVDLTALGMVSRFLWAETTAGGRGSDPVLEDISHTHADGLSITTDKLSQTLAHDSGRSILLVILDMAGDAHHDDGNVRDWRSRLNDQLGTHVEILHLYVPKPGVGPLHQYGDLPTLILSPEEAATPKERTSPVAYPAAQHTAASLAGIAGLWATSTSSPFFEEAAANRISGAYGQGQLVRVYHNYSDAADAEAALYNKVFTLDGNMPHPKANADARVLDVGDDQNAVSRYADAIMDRHGHEFVTPTSPLASSRAKKVNAWETIKRFFQFFFTAVIGNPIQWAAEARNKGQKVLASGVQNLLYGSDSNIEVVLGNQSGKTLRPLSEVEAGAKQLHRDAGGQDDLNMSQETSLPHFWQAYTDAAMTLVDGGRGGDEITGPNHDGVPAIVSDVRWSVPSDDHAFDGENKILRDNVGSHITETRIQPYDPYNANVYYSAIDLASRNTRNTTVHRLKDDFVAWRDTVRRSFGWQMGERLFGKMEEAQAKFHAVREKAQHNKEELDGLQDDDAKLRSLSNTLRGWSLAWLVIILVLVYLCLSHYNFERAWALVDWSFFTWQRTLFVGIAVTAVILVVQMLVFARAHKGIYDARERRRVLQTNEEILGRDVITANQEVSRCLASYNQFLAWSAIVSRAMSRPFGEIRAATLADHHPDSGLPDNTVVDSVQLDERQVLDYSRRIRDDVFTKGWASDALERYLERGIDVVPSRMATKEETYRLYGQFGLNTQLAEIAEACRDGELFADSTQADLMWQESLRSIRSTSDTLGMHRGKLATDMAAIASGQEQSSFSSAALSAVGTNYDANNVDDSLTFAESSQSDQTLSQAFTVVQYGISADVRAFDTTEEQDAGASEQSVPSVPTLGGQPQPPQMPPPQPGGGNPFSGLM